MDWPTVITIVLGSSVLGAIINSIISLVFARRERDRHNCYIALILAHDFEQYAHHCFNIVCDDELHESSGGHAGKPLDYPPEPKKLPEENYRNFDIKLLDTIIEFPQKVAFAKDEVVFLFEVNNDEDAHETSCENTIKLASIALNIADRLRQKYSLPARDLKFGEFDLRKALNDK